MEGTVICIGFGKMGARMMFFLAELATAMNHRLKLRDWPFFWMKFLHPNGSEHLLFSIQDGNGG